MQYHKCNQVVQTEAVLAVMRSFFFKLKLTVDGDVWDVLLVLKKLRYLFLIEYNVTSNNHISNHIILFYPGKTEGLLIHLVYKMYFFHFKHLDGRIMRY